MRSRYSRTLENRRNALIRQLLACHGISPEDVENFQIAQNFCRNHLAPHNNRHPDPSRHRCERHVADLAERFLVHSEVKRSQGLLSLFQAYQQALKRRKLASREDTHHSIIQFLCLIAENGTSPVLRESRLDSMLKADLTEGPPSLKVEESVVGWEELRGKMDRAKAQLEEKQRQNVEDIQEDKRIVEALDEWEKDFQASEDDYDSDTDHKQSDLDSKIKTRAEGVFASYDADDDDDHVDAKIPTFTDKPRDTSASHKRMQVKGMLEMTPPAWLMTDPPLEQRAPWDKLRAEVEKMRAKGLDLGLSAMHEKPIREADLIQDIVALVEGFPSGTFQENSRGEFEVRPGAQFRIRHMSASLVESVISSVVLTANAKHSIQRFTTRSNQLQSQCFQAFAFSIEQHVSAFERAFTNFTHPSKSNPDPVPLTLSRILSWIENCNPGIRFLQALTDQARVLLSAKLRRPTRSTRNSRVESSPTTERSYVSTSSGSPGGQKRGFSFASLRWRHKSTNAENAEATGGLLSMLCGAVDEAGLSNSKLLPLAAEIFLSTAKPYLRKLDTFLSQGAVKDSGGEFMVVQRRLRTDSQHFWDHSLAFAPGSGAIPFFFQGCASELLLTGRALRLLTMIGQDQRLSDVAVPTSHGDLIPSMVIEDGGANALLQRILGGLLGLDKGDLAHIGIEREFSDSKEQEDKSACGSVTESDLSLCTSSAIPEEVVKASIEGCKGLCGESVDALLGKSESKRGEEKRLYLLLEPRLNQALTRYVLNQYVVVGKRLGYVFSEGGLGLRTYLSALRAVFFMESGEAARHFQDSLFPCLADRRWPEQQVVEGMLQDAIRIDKRCEAALDGHIRVEVVSPSSQSSGCEQLAWLSRLKVHCNVSWPLNMIITPKLMDQYATVFRFLLMVRYSKWVLDRLSEALLNHNEGELHTPNLLDKTRRKLSIIKSDVKVQKGHFRSRVRRLTPSVHQFYVLRAKLQHVVGCIQDYMRGRAVYGAWVPFDQELDDVSTSCNLPRMRDAHGAYLDEVRRQMLLSSRSWATLKKIKSLLAIAIQLQDIAQLILALQRRPSSAEQQKNATRDELKLPSGSRIVGKIAEVSKKVDGDVEFLLKVLNQVMNHGYNFHFKELVARLDFNGYFSKISNL
ncbi:hypothetical protein AAMO2058_001532100 [Amorphochlora amoebiformis]